MERCYRCSTCKALLSLEQIFESNKCPHCEWVARDSNVCDFHKGTRVWVRTSPWFQWWGYTGHYEYEWEIPGPKTWVAYRQEAALARWRLKATIILYPVIGERAAEDFDLFPDLPWSHVTEISAGKQSMLGNCYFTAQESTEKLTFMWHVDFNRVNRSTMLFEVNEELVKDVSGVLPSDQHPAIGEFLDTMASEYCNRIRSASISQEQHKRNIGTILRLRRQLDLAPPGE